MNIKKIFLALHSIGLGSSAQTARYSMFRDWLERTSPPHETPTTLVTPGQLQSTETIPGGSVFHFKNINLEVIFLCDDIVRISWLDGKPPVPYALARTQWPLVTPVHKETSSFHELESDALRITVEQDGNLRFENPTGQLLHADLPPEWCGETWKLVSDFQANEHVYGLGERAASLNLRGKSYKMWNSDPGGSYGPGKDPIYICIPAYISLHNNGSYLVFYENYHPGTVTLENQAEVSFEGGMLRYYIIPGSPSKAINRYTELVGRARLPPRWALGYHQCRWGYRNEADIRQVIAGFQEHDLPISAIHLDIDYMEGFRVFTVDKERFPDLPGLASDLAAQGIHTVVILDPGVKQDPNYEVYQDGIKEKAFCQQPNGKPLVGLVWPGRSVFPDFTDPQARLWWGKRYAGLIEAGIAGCWHDMNEPTSFSAWGDMTLPLPTRHSMEGTGGSHAEAHNLYGLLMNRAGYDAIRRFAPDKRPWLITRSGWAGVHRYAWNWTGDTETSWAALRQTITTILGLSMSGHPFTGPDIGGFSGSPSAELYLRWFQLAAFLPFFRTHSAVGTDRREPWVYGEPTTSIVREFLRLRYRLLPYIYTLAWEAHREGTPLVRPLFWNDSYIPNLWDIDDAFLLGDALLVAPILEAGAQTRRVVFPEGGWYSLWDDTYHQGIEQTAVTLERIPVFVRSGSILPMEENGILTLHLYPPPATDQPITSQLYSDAGDGYQAWRLDHYKVLNMHDNLEITWANEGVYPFPYQKVLLHIHAISPKRAWIDDKEIVLDNSLLETGQFHHLTI